MSGYLHKYSEKRKMSGSKLAEALCRVAYPNAETLDGGALDWMFEHQATLPLLEWLCDEIGSGNVFTATEREEFEELENSSEVILDGAELETALQAAEWQQDDITEEQLRQEIADLEEEHELCDERKKILLHHRNKLSLHHSSVSDKINKMTSLEKVASSEYRAALEQAQADNAKMNETITVLVKTVLDVTSLYLPAKSTPVIIGTSANQMVVFLSQCDLDSYHKVEDKYTQELTAYTKRLFFEGIARVSGQEEKSRYDLLEISEPETLLVSGERTDAKLDDCKELARLQAYFPKGERERINSILTERGLLAACEFIERKLETLKQIPFPKESRHLKEKISETEAVLAALRREEVESVEQKHPRLIHDCAASQATRVLRGDYDLKISRQDYFIANQEKVIKELVVQRARNELLAMAYESEEREHRDLHRLLTAVNLLLQRHQRAVNDRMALMQDPNLQASRHQRNTVDSRNTYLAALNTILEPTTGSADKKQSLFLTNDAMKGYAKCLAEKVSSVRSSQSTNEGSRDERLKTLEKCVDKCEALVYCGSSTIEGQPSLSPQPLCDVITQLDGLLGKLEQAVMDVMKDVDNKKKALKADPLLAVERDLMTYFHTDPNKLRRVVDELASRVQAQMVT